MEDGPEECWQGETVRFAVRLINKGSRDIVIDKILKSCSCTGINLAGATSDGLIVIPSRGQLSMDLEILTAGRVGRFEPSIALKKIGEANEDAKIVSFPVFVKQGMEAFPPSIAFRFNESDLSLGLQTATFELCDNLQDGVVASRIEPSSLKIEASVENGDLDRTIGEKLRRHAKITVSTSPTDWDESTSEYLDVYVEYNGIDMPTPSKIRVPISISVESQFLVSPKGLTIAVVKGKKSTARISVIAKQLISEASISRLPECISGTISVHDTVAWCDLVIDPRDTIMKEQREEAVFLVNNKVIYVPIILVAVIEEL